MIHSIKNTDLIFHVIRRSGGRGDPTSMPTTISYGTHTTPSIKPVPASPAGGGGKKIVEMTGFGEVLRSAMEVRPPRAAPSPDRPQLALRLSDAPGV